ncbi:hypothetical protein FB451DRAFT_1162015 [Mycena latifolia]|nr:hypothetical protein FB451DRAFT_1162015 [Mycena latifolia]
MSSHYIPQASYYCPAPTQKCSGDEHMEESSKHSRLENPSQATLSHGDYNGSIAPTLCWIVWSGNSRSFSCKKKEAQAVNLLGPKSSATQKTHTVEVQPRTCQAGNYSGTQPCFVCQGGTKWCGPSNNCQWRGVQLLQKHSAKYEAVRIKFPEEPTTLHFPVAWNRQIDLNDLAHTKATSAEVLLPVMQEELSHLTEHPVYRPSQPGTQMFCARLLKDSGKRFTAVVIPNYPSSAVLWGFSTAWLIFKH